jgi:hypothetical protein
MGRVRPLLRKSGLSLGELGRRIGYGWCSRRQVCVAISDEDNRPSIEHAGKVRGSYKCVTGRFGQIIRRFRAG